MAYIALHRHMKLNWDNTLLLINVSTNTTQVYWPRIKQLSLVHKIKGTNTKPRPKSKQDDSSIYARHIKYKKYTKTKDFCDTRLSSATIKWVQKYSES